MFDNYDVEWSERSDYLKNAEKQFREIYSKLFKEVILNYDERVHLWPEWHNNFYIDSNPAKFGLCVKGRNYEEYAKQARKI